MVTVFKFKNFCKLLSQVQQEELITTFDEQLFNTFVEKNEIHQDKSVTITLKNKEAISLWYGFFFRNIHKPKNLV